MREIYERIHQSGGDPDSCSVYFVLARGANAVKIGIAGDLERRLAAMQVACPLVLELLATVEYPRRVMAVAAERRIHVVLEDHNLRGEWYLMTPHVRDFVGYVKATRQVEPLLDLERNARINLPEAARQYVSALPIT